MAQIYTSDQILDNIIKAKKLNVDQFDWFHYDEMWYETQAKIPYETEGSLFDTTGGPGVIDGDTGALAGNRARINTGNFNLVIDPTKEQLMKVRSGMFNATNAHHFIGYYDALPTAANPPVDPSDGIYFRAKNAGASVNWFAVSKKVGSETAVDTGILATVSQKLFEIRVTATKIIYLIDGTVVATITTNIPVLKLFWGIVTVTIVASIREFQIDMLLLAGKR